MIKVIGVIAAFLVIVSLDILSILKTNQRKKTVILYCILISAAFSISLLLALDMAPTSPSVLIEDVIKNIFGSEL